jgi:hypothetical protein
MYIVPLAWLYVALMMSVAEATNTTGTVLGAVITFVLYGLLPVGLILYFMGAGARRRDIKQREAQQIESENRKLSDSHTIAPGPVPGPTPARITPAKCTPPADH